MIRKKSGQIITSMDKMRGGRLTTQIASFLTEEEAHGTGRGFSINTIPPGGSIGWHQHVGDFEVYLILEGTAKVTENDGSEHPLGVEDMMFCQDGDYHSIENSGDTPLRFLSLILYTPNQ